MKQVAAIVLLIAAMLPSFLASADASPTRRAFKEALWRAQAGLMGKHEYEKFITPYLERAERDLVAARFCSQHDGEACLEYLNTLVTYNSLFSIGLSASLAVGSNLALMIALQMPSCTSLRDLRSGTP